MGAGAIKSISKMQGMNSRSSTEAGEKKSFLSLNN